MTTDTTTQAAMQLMKRIEQLEAELAETTAVLTDYQKAHDVTIAGRDKLSEQLRRAARQRDKYYDEAFILKVRLANIRTLVATEEWNADFRQVLVDALGRTP